MQQQKDKCTCDYCRFQPVGVAKEAVEFVDQVEIKKQMLDFVRVSFEEANPEKCADGYSDNTIAILLGEWGLGKTQLLKYFRLAIDNAADVTTQLKGKFGAVPLQSPNIAQVRFDAIIDDIILDDPEFAEKRDKYMQVFNKYRGIAFWIRAKDFKDAARGQYDDLLIPLFNMLLERCQLDFKAATQEDLQDVCQRILTRFAVQRIFIFFDELEELRAEESSTFEFFPFAREFAASIKSVIDNTYPANISLCLATIPSVWEELYRRFTTIGAIGSRASTFMRLNPLTLPQAQKFVLGRCQTVENCPFSDGAIRTILEASGYKPRLLSQLCSQLHETVKNNPQRQYEEILHLLQQPATDDKDITFDYQSLKGFKDEVSTELSKLPLANKLIDILAGELREYSPAEFIPLLERNNVPEIEKTLDELSNTRLRGVLPVVKLHRLDKTKVLMQGQSLKEQQRLLTKQNRYLAEKDVQIEQQRLKVHDLDYEKEIIRPLEATCLDASEPKYFLPDGTDNAGLEELCQLWNIAEGSALSIYRTLAAIGQSQTTHYYRLSYAARERIFPRQSPKTPPFEWIPEEFWRDAFARMHNPTTPLQDKNNALLRGLMCLAQALKGKFEQIDEHSFCFRLPAEAIDNAEYADKKDLSFLVLLSNELPKVEDRVLHTRMGQCRPDALVLVSTVHLAAEKLGVIDCPEGRPQIELVYKELNTTATFKVQLLAEIDSVSEDASWYDSDKFKKAAQDLFAEILADVVDHWINVAQERGVLVAAWDTRGVDKEEDLTKTIRKLIGIIPSLPLPEESIGTELYQLGYKERFDVSMLDTLKKNGQIRENADGSVDWVVLPTQQRIIELATIRYQHRHGELLDDYVARIQEHFWEARGTDLLKELRRHVMIVNELGYFENHRDLDMILEDIETTLCKVTEPTEEDATIDQYAFTARRRKDPIGAAKAERLAKERDYYREQYRLYVDEFQQMDNNMELLRPRVIRHQLVDIEKRAKEILAVGEKYFEQGENALRQARSDLNTARYELVQSTDIQVLEHGEKLRELENDRLSELIRRHKEGVVDEDEDAGAVREEIEREIESLKQQKAQVGQRIEDYKSQHRSVYTKAQTLARRDGLKERVQPHLNDLRNKKPETMLREFKKSFANDGFQRGLECVDEGIAWLREEDGKLSEIEQYSKDYAKLEQIITVLKDRVTELSKYRENLSSVHLPLLEIDLELTFLENICQQRLREMKDWLDRLMKLREEYEGKKREKEELEKGTKFAEGTGDSISELHEWEREARENITEYLINPLDELSEDWDNSSTASERYVAILRRYQRLWLKDCTARVSELFKSESQEAFLKELPEATEWLDKFSEVRGSIDTIVNWLSGSQLDASPFVSTTLEEQTAKLAKQAQELFTDAEALSEEKEHDSFSQAQEYLQKVGERVSAFQESLKELEEQVKALWELERQRLSNFVMALSNAGLLSQSEYRQLQQNLPSITTFSIENYQAQRENLEQKRAKYRELANQSANEKIAQAFSAAEQDGWHKNLQETFYEAWIARFAELTEAHFAVGFAEDALESAKKNLVPEINGMVTSLETLCRIVDWYDTNSFTTQDYADTDLSEEANSLEQKHDTIRSQVRDLAKERGWVTLVSVIDELGTDDKCDGIPGFRREVQQLEEKADHKVDRKCEQMKDFTEAMLRAGLLAPEQRQEFLDQLTEVAKSRESYVQRQAELSKLQMEIEQAARSNIEQQNLSFGQNPDAVLRLVKEVYSKEYVTFSQLLALDRDTEGETLFGLLEHQILDANIRLHKEQ